MQQHTMPIAFASDAHKQRFVAIVEQMGKVYNGQVDREYGAALFILTEDDYTWECVKPYINRHIDFEAILSKVDWSGAYSELIKLAANLFNSNRYKANPGALTRLDENNFELALMALQIVYSGIALNEQE